MSHLLPTKVLPYNLKRLRKSRSMTQEKLAELSGKSKNYISQLEMGTRQPSLKTLDAFCLILEVKAYEFFLEDDDYGRIMVVDKDEYALMDSLKKYIGNQYREDRNRE